LGKARQIMGWSANRAILIVAVILCGAAALPAGSWPQSHSARIDAQRTVLLLIANAAPALRAPIGAAHEREIDRQAQSRPDSAFADLAQFVKNRGWVTIPPFVGNEPIIATKVSASDQTASLSTVVEKGKHGASLT
jgi:Flp pilus assembly protein CpaB